jgi:hypothetical protein
MNDLITILIIIAAIISFLNRIFGQKKQQQTTRRQPIPQQKPKEWIPPWLEPADIEIQIPAEEDLDRVEEIEHKKPLWYRQELKKEMPPPSVVSEKKIVAPNIVEIAKPEVKSLKGLNIELASRDDLKRGIVLAEILAPCRARRKQQRI